MIKTNPTDRFVAHVFPCRPAQYFLFMVGFWPALFQQNKTIQATAPLHQWFLWHWLLLDSHLKPFHYNGAYPSCQASKPASDYLGYWIRGSSFIMQKSISHLCWKRGGRDWKCMLFSASLGRYWRRALYLSRGAEAWRQCTARKSTGGCGKW